ncbi:MAG: tripartite tricarboxylate transporter TctB family protein, partial [Armatimonadota bacterium]
PMPGVRDSVRMALLSLLFVVLLPLVGFLAASALFLLASVLSTKRVNLWQAIGFTLVVSAGVWWLFQNVLGVPLP